MDENLISNILSLTQLSIALIISLRAFYICFQSVRDRNYRLLILAVGMGVLSITALASYAGDNFPDLPISVSWFKYLSQTVSFLFILLSLCSNDEVYLRRLLYWQLGISLALFVLLNPLISKSVPNPMVIRIVLGGSRSLSCFIVFFFYLYAFMMKETRFSLLMSMCFLCLATGYMLNIPKYFDSHQLMLDHVGDMFRISGLLTLLVAIFLG